LTCLLREDNITLSLGNVNKLIDLPLGYLFEPSPSLLRRTGYRTKRKNF